MIEFSIKSLKQGVGLLNKGKYEYKWYVQLQCNKKTYRIGKYKTELEAAKAYDKAAKEHFGEFAKLNFPEEI